MKTKNRNTIYGFLSVIIVMSTLLPYHVLHKPVNIIAQDVSEGEVEFNLIEYLLQHNLSEDILEHAELIDSIKNEENTQLNTAALLSGTKVDLPWWFELLIEKPLLGVAVILGLGAITYVTNMVKALFREIFIAIFGEVEWINDLIAAIQVLMTLEDAFREAKDNFEDNIEEICGEVLYDALKPLFEEVTYCLYEVRQMTYVKLENMNTAVDWENSKHYFVDNYIVNSKSFDFKNTAGNLMYLCAMETWIALKDPMYPMPTYKDPKTWYEPFIPKSWFEPYGLNSWSDFADYALFYNLELSTCYRDDIAGLPDIIISDDHNIGFDFSNNGFINYKSDHYIQSLGYISFLGTKRSQDVDWVAAFICVDEDLTWQQNIEQVSNSLVNEYINAELWGYNVDDPDSNLMPDGYKEYVESTQMSTWETIIMVYNSAPPFDPNPIKNLMYITAWLHVQEQINEYKRTHPNVGPFPVPNPMDPDSWMSFEDYENFCDSIFDIDNDGQWDADPGFYDENFGGSPYDIDNDGQWDADPGFYGYDDYSDSYGPSSDPNDFGNDYDDDDSYGGP